MTRAALVGTTLPATRDHRNGQPISPLPPPQPRPATKFGPRTPELDPTERIAQFRSSAVLAAVFFGSQHRLVAELRNGETDVEVAARALDLLDHTPSLTRRKLLSVFGAITWPRGPK
jgi:hypothetical protein